MSILNTILNWLGINQAYSDTIKQLPQYKVLVNYITALTNKESSLRDDISGLKEQITGSSPFSIFTQAARKALTNKEKVLDKTMQQRNDAENLVNDAQDQNVLDRGTTETLTNDIKTFVGGINEKV